MSKAVYFIKRQLGFPNVGIELYDEDIEMEIKMFVIPEFSKYVPHLNELLIDTTNPETHTDQSNVYYIFDPDGRSILNILRVIPDESDLMFHNYPYTQPYANTDMVTQYVQDIENAETTMKFTGASKTFTFIQPNKIRIFPQQIEASPFIIRYEREHKEDLSTIPFEYETDFLYLALAHIMIICGNIRNKYQAITTPFGDVPLNADIRERGDTIKQSVIDKLNQLPPNILIDVW
jgi:hypothetical protein